MDTAETISDRSTRVDELISRLRERGMRMTPQRMAIVRALVMNGGHPSAVELHRRLLPEYPTMSLATIYKTINMLKEIGEVLELEFSSRDNRYDGHNPLPHPHVICTSCGQVLDPPVSGLDGIIGELAGRTGYEISSHRLDVYGLCPDCRSGK
jgi:Fur family peroxide stress response transcriptional regulator